MKVKSFRTLKSYNYRPKTFEDLRNVLVIKSDEEDDDLNDIDVSLLDKVGGFYEFKFFKNNNFYVDEWDVSNVKDFNSCFILCYKFNCELLNWDVSNGVNMFGFFNYTTNFNQNINHFNVYNSENMSSFLFKSKSFNQPLYKFKFNYKMKFLNSFFFYCLKFNQDISMWDVSNVESFSWMFFNTKNFLQDLSGWNVSNAKSWSSIFNYSKMEKHPELMPEKFRKYYI